MAIKKVVIPKTEVKWVCELSENEFTPPTDIMPDGVLHVSLNAIQRRLTKIEIPKPLANDETSLNSPINTNAIYAFYDGFDIEVIHDKCVNSNFNFYSLERTAYTIKTAMEAGHTVYEFSGKNKQKEFFEWALEQIKGESND